MRRTVDKRRKKAVSYGQKTTEDAGVRKKLACIFLAALWLLPLVGLGEKQAVITFLGDCTIGGEEWLRGRDTSFDGYYRANGPDYFFEKVQGVIACDDLTVANLECVLSPNEGGKVKKTYCFRGLPEYTRVLTGSSVECVNVANNHALDYADTGMRRTQDILDGAGVQWFGSNEVVRKTWIYEKDGVKIGFVGAEIHYWALYRPYLLKQINALRQEGCQVIVASLHGGAEYGAVRDKGQENASHWFVDNGCDVVIGHHPHVPLGIEVYKNATICFSLGNFVFGGNAAVKKPRARYTGLFQFTFSFDDGGKYLGHQLNIIPAFVSSDPLVNHYQPYPVGGEDAKAVLQCIQADTAFRLKPYAEGVGAVQDFVAAGEK